MKARAVTFGSVCSGIEAASVAWHPLGWRAAFLSEIDKFPRAVLRHHYPDIPLHGDFTTIREGEYDAIDILVGGTPCQSFSIAGLRGGLADDRGNLALEYLKLAQRLRPRWILWENVPGVLSSAGGRDFGSILRGLGELGYGFAYRVLDAQYFGVPQRRRRVFLVGYLGDWRRAAAVLFERHSLQGHSPPRREAGERSAPTISARPSGGGGLGTDFDCDGGLIARCDTAREGISRDWETDTLVTHPLRGESFDAGEDGAGRGTPIVPVLYSIMPMNSGRDYKARAVDVAQPIMAAGAVGGNQGGDYLVQPVAFAMRGREGGAMPEISGDAVSALRSAPGGSTRDMVAFGGAGALAKIESAVRRLTPRECERLQGFPDDYTLIPWRKGVAPDGPRYKALGNSMAVPVMRWIGERINAVEAIQSVELDAAS